MDNIIKIDKSKILNKKTRINLGSIDDKIIWKKIDINEIKIIDRGIQTNNQYLILIVLGKDNSESIDNNESIYGYNKEDTLNRFYKTINHKNSDVYKQTMEMIHKTHYNNGVFEDFTNMMSYDFINKFWKSDRIIKSKEIYKINAEIMKKLSL